LFNDEVVEVIGTQMPEHVEGSRKMSMRGETEDVSKIGDDIGKKKGGRAVDTKAKKTQKCKNRQSGVGRFGR